MSPADEIRNIRVHLRVLLDEAEREAWGISDDRDAHICVMRALDGLRHLPPASRLDAPAAEPERFDPNERVHVEPRKVMAYRPVCSGTVAAKPRPFREDDPEPASPSRAALLALQKLVTTTLVSSEYATLLRWRARFLDDERAEDDPPAPPAAQLICYAIADAMQLREVEKALAALLTSETSDQAP